MPTQDTLNFISQEFHIYFGLFILILGVIGGILNVLIFTTFQIFRETICAFYLTVVSIVNIGQLLTALLVRILSGGFYIDIRRTSWGCKVQVYIAVWCALVSTTTMCLATIDQYISMSPYRNYSSKRLAKLSIVLTCSFWGLYSICFLIYLGAPLGTCTTINSSFAIYRSHFHFPILIGFLPLSTMTTFSLLAFKNARTLISRQMNIVRLSRDRQLTAMTLFHAVFVVITVIPYTIVSIYSLNQTSEDPEQIARNNLINTVTILINYSSFAAPFYIYCCISKRFRKQFLHVLMKACVNGPRQLINTWSNNQIAPYMETISNTQPTITKRVTVDIAHVNVFWRKNASEHGQNTKHVRTRAKL